jgi:hypothetical protein
MGKARDGKRDIAWWEAVQGQGILKVSSLRCREITSETGIGCISLNLKERLKCSANMNYVV